MMKRRIMTAGLLVVWVCAGCSSLLAGAGKGPNEAGSAILEKLKSAETSLETIYGYFSHYSPVVRKNAAEAMAKRGEAAMPFLIRGLKTGRKYESRAACDAISGIRGFFGVNVKEANYPITTEMAATAMPHIVALLDHEDFYVRAGALHALSKCGKAAAPHLPRAVTFLKDDEWWIRDGAGCVIEGVGSPESDPYLEDLANAMAREQHIECLNAMSWRLPGLLKTAPAETRDRVLLLVAGNVPQMDGAFRRFRGRGVLDALGTDARVALPLIEKYLKEQEELVKKGEAVPADAQWELDQLKATREKLAGEKPQRQ
jgi:hypothetical protein